MFQSGLSLVGVRTVVQQGLRREETDPSWPICFDHILDGPPAYGTACIDLSLELQPTVVAQAHVSTSVDDRVHLLIEADGALSAFASRGQLGDRKQGRGCGDQWGAGSSHLRRSKKTNERVLKWSRLILAYMTFVFLLLWED